MTFDDLAKRLARCAECDGDGLVLVYDEDGSSWDDTCDDCHGTGLDPERVEVLRGFERETLFAAARECRRRAELHHKNAFGHDGLHPGYYPAHDHFRCEAERCAAAIEAMAAKPAGDTERTARKAT